MLTAPPERLESPALAQGPRAVGLDGSRQAALAHWQVNSWVRCEDVNSYQLQQVCHLLAPGALRPAGPTVVRFGEWRCARGNPFRLSDQARSDRAAFNDTPN